METITSNLSTLVRVRQPLPKQPFKTGDIVNFTSQYLKHRGLSRFKALIDMEFRKYNDDGTCTLKCKGKNFYHKKFTINAIQLKQK